LIAAGNLLPNQGIDRSGSDSYVFDAKVGRAFGTITAS